MQEAASRGGDSFNNISLADAALVTNQFWNAIQNASFSL